MGPESSCLWLQVKDPESDHFLITFIIIKLDIEKCMFMMHLLSVVSFNLCFILDSDIHNTKFKANQKDKLYVPHLYKQVIFVS